MMDYNEVTAWSTVVLAVITGYYAYISRLTFRELNKDRQIAAIEKKLEKVYSPFEEAITTLKNDVSEDDPHGIPTPESVERQYYIFDKKITEVKKNYGHLIDPDIIKNHFNIWEISKRAFIIVNVPKSRKEYDQHIDNFLKDVRAKKHKYQIELANLQERKFEIEDF
ncbi:Uncharacterised protein [uncultured archaeon]|nr:Uncharacterised protein [uncultured archaeon]